MAETASGIDVRTVSGRLGHSLTSTTLNVYAAFVPDADRRAAEVMGRLAVGHASAAGTPSAVPIRMPLPRSTSVLLRQGVIVATLVMEHRAAVLSRE